MLTRRDVCSWVKDTYNHILNMHNNWATNEEISDVIKVEISRLCNGEVDHKKLISSRTVLNYHNMSNYFMKVFCDRLRSQGRIINVGSRIEYMVIYKETVYSSSDKMMLSEDCEKNPVQIDYNYYIGQLLGYVDKLLGTDYYKQYKKCNV